MAAIHKLTVNDYDQDCFLVALHTGVEDYSIAFALNKVLKTGFKRTEKDLEVTANASVSVFEWENERDKCFWTLLGNKSEADSENNAQDLFSEIKTKQNKYLIPELKEVDYFLKIEDPPEYVKNTIVEKIKQIPNIVTAYAVEYGGLKSKNNLIF
jgi:hypothetical protein